MGLAVGIDLGTSNSVVAYYQNGEPRILADAKGNTVHPSVVAFGYGESTVVGHRARQQLTYAPENTIASVKRLMGRRFDSVEVERMRAMVAWGIAEGPNLDARVRIQGKVYAVPEVSAHVLRHMKQIAEEALGEVVDKAVITVPAYFNDQQRQATRDAATIAGLECLRIINEPTAAALAYGYRKGKRQHVAVYDLGGGTFDISLLRIDDDFFEVVSTAGDTFLGGDDFDTALSEHLLATLQQTTGVELSTRHVALTKIREAAEKAKRELSSAASAEIRVPNLARDESGQPIHLITTLDRSMLSRLVMPLIQRTFLVVDDALKQARLTATQIDEVLLVGGMTRLPLIREAVGHYFRRKAQDNINPDEVVALGAAIQAHTLTDTAGIADAVLLDVTPQSLGVRTVGGFVEQIIPRNTPIPTQAGKVFHTATDNQDQVRIQVFQGESRMAEDNDFLGDFVLDNLRPAPRGEIAIRITFSIDTDGIVAVRARDEETGQETDMLLEASSNLSRDEVQRLRFDELGF
ncbi:MAG: molecular chaperone DnaK [Myxococcota bacterium]|nr:molecular chaperone DnaK [Myxococcota bacterium]